MDTKKQNLELLCKQGLSDKQSRIYYALLSLGESSIAAVAKKAVIKRPTAYVVIEQLDTMGLISRRESGGKLFYRALSPYLLVERAKKAALQFEQEIPQLLSLHPLHSAIPQITQFAGPEAIARSLQDRLNAKTELYFWADNNLQFTDKQLATTTQLTYMQQRIKKRIWTRGLIPYEPKLSRYRDRQLFDLQEFYKKMKLLGSREYREFVFLPRRNSKRNTEIWIFDNIVEFFSTTDFVGTRIENAAYADSMRTIFLSQLEAARASEAQLMAE